jgi:nucleoside 2-deoxyribosyltransferase
MTERCGMTLVYLAGPDVFLPDAAAWMERKKAVCAEHGLTGVSPLDHLADEPPAWGELPEWRRIALRNEAHISLCAAVLANLTPFRGPSADVGTVYEVGFARGLGLPVFGYATVSAAFFDRTLSAVGGGHQMPDGSWRDQDGLLVEQFGLFDNLMIEAAITASGGSLICKDQDRWRNLSVFERCVQEAAAALVSHPLNRVLRPHQAHPESCVSRPHRH